MNLPESGRVIVIDDKADEGLPLIKVLSKYRISTTYFTGEINELPPEPFNDVRIIFLDLVLGGMTGRDEKTILSTLINVIKRIVHTNNGPFIIVLWTKHDEYIDRFKNILRGENYKAMVLNLQKSECQNGAGRSYDMEKIKKNLDERLNLKIFNLFLLWENILHDSASNTVNDFSKLVDFDDTNRWNTKMLKVFYNLARAQAGRRLNEGETLEILKNSLFTFMGIFQDTAEKKIHNVSFSPLDNFETGEIDKRIKAEINSRLLLDFSTQDGLYPGNVYKIDEKMHIEGGLNTSNANELEEIKNKSIPVIVEVSPLCDFAQNKMKLSRIVKGFLCPAEVQINGTTIQSYKKLKSRAHFLYIAPVIEYQEKLYRLVIDFRHFSANSIDEINGNRPIFRLRKDILIDIQTKLSSHINRPGVLFVE